ncbi:hypothetical protein L1887_48415 [Cichorium endivia]|nr:hypothetical protein L1887_48415 [Cichorium endivia]
MSVGAAEGSGVARIVLVGLVGEGDLDGQVGALYAVERDDGALALVEQRVNADELSILETLGGDAGGKCPGGDAPLGDEEAECVAGDEKDGEDEGPLLGPDPLVVLDKVGIRPDGVEREEGDHVEVEVGWDALVQRDAGDLWGLDRELHAGQRCATTAATSASSSSSDGGGSNGEGRCRCALRASVRAWHEGIDA